MVAIGGIGGSGTRVVAQLFKEANYFMGNDLNECNDNLLFTLLYKRESILVSSDKEFDLLWDIFRKVMTGKGALSKREINFLKFLSLKDRTLHSKEFLQDRLRFLTHDIEAVKSWGWKEPNTHIVIEKLLKKEKDLKFIYVYRHGLDMAYSPNQNQLKLWGGSFFSERNIDITPKNALKYWCIIHRRMSGLRKLYPDRVFLLDFDKMCTNREEGLCELERFMSFDVNFLGFRDIIKRPSSIGRHKAFPIDCFNEEDLRYITKISAVPRGLSS